ncbi:hypothetical protein BDR07DRAFT_2922 [Suillus spraguei]|nr:hypothetical protein BDR07DRAFT_2922 [Suillus spraguei]
MDIEKYDEYVQGPEREVITVETKIKSTNKGFAMLAKLGWSEGQPLGLSPDARVDPVPFHVKNDLTGLGKTTQDFRMIETTVAERRKLDSERQRKETEYQRKAREDDAARRAALKSEISDTLKAFYCSLCEKQFQNVAQYDEHTNSYAHHHKARLRDMQANTRMTTQEDVDKRKEKERKREEKELRKIAKAAGIKMTKPITTPAVVPPVQTPAVAEASLSSEVQSSSFKKAGWATVSAPVEAATGFKRPGWASLDSNASSAPSAPLSPPPPPVVSLPPASRSAATPTFRTGGWTSLDVSSSQFLTPPPPNNTAPPPPPPPNVTPPPPPVTSMNAPPLGGGPPFSPANVRPPSVPLPPCAPPPSGLPPFPPTTGGWGPAALVSDPRNQSFAPAPTFSQPTPPVAASPPISTSLKATVPPPAAPQAKSGWQQWKQGSGSKRR